jgi:hypothetical protein
LQKPQKIEELRDIGRAAAYPLRYRRLAPIAKPVSHPVEGRDGSGKKCRKKISGGVDLRQMEKMGAADMRVRSSLVLSGGTLASVGRSRIATRGFQRQMTKTVEQACVISIARH